MEEYTYLVTNEVDRVYLVETKKEAELRAKRTLGYSGDINYIYEVKKVAECYYPEPDPVVSWD